MFASSQNYSSPLGSPAKRQNIENSPVSSPMKNARPQSSYDQKASYTPYQKEEVVGQPLEIIKGKSRIFSF